MSQACLRMTDAEAVSMSRYLVQHDGLFLRSSSASWCNLVARVEWVRQMGWHDLSCRSNASHIHRSADHESPYVRFWQSSSFKSKLTHRVARISSCSDKWLRCCTDKSFGEDLPIHQSWDPLISTSPFRNDEYLNVLLIKQSSRT